MLFRSVPPLGSSCLSRWGTKYRQARNASSGPVRFDLHGFDTAGKKWRSWGTLRRASFWSEVTLPQTLVECLVGKQLSDVVRPDAWLSPLGEWEVVSAASDANGLLLVCRPPNNLANAAAHPWWA